MAIAVVQEFTGPADDRSTTNYDEISEHSERTPIRLPA